MEHFRFPKDLHDSEIWSGLRHESQKLFLFLLCNMEHKTVSRSFMRSSFELHRGDYITTIRTLATSLDFSRKMVENTLNELVEVGLIAKQTRQAGDMQETRGFMSKRTVVSVTKPHRYVGKMEEDSFEDINTEFANPETLIGMEDKEYEFIKTKKIKERPKSIAKEETTPELDLNPSSRNYRERLCERDWIRSLRDVTEGVWGDIEEMVLTYARLKYYEGNPSLSLKLFRYHCGKYILKHYADKRRGSKRSRSAYPERDVSHLPQYQPARMDPSRIPGYRPLMVDEEENAVKEREK